MNRTEIEKFYYFPEEDYPDYDPEILLTLDDGSTMIGYLENCHWLSPNEEPDRQDCITFMDYTDLDEIGHEIMWLIQRKHIVKMEWVNELPPIN